MLFLCVCVRQKGNLIEINFANAKKIICQRAVKFIKFKPSSSRCPAKPKLQDGILNRSSILCLALASCQVLFHTGVAKTKQIFFVTQKKTGEKNMRKMVWN